MKKLLIILTVFVLSLAFVAADISITADGKSIKMTEIDTGKNNTFLYKIELSTTTDPNNDRYGIDGLKRGEVTFQSQDYWFHDSILIEVEVDLEKGYKTNVEYYYVFDETIDMTQTSLNSPLEIEVLGEPYKITGVSSGTDFTFCNDCDSHTLDVSDSVEVGGKRITLHNVGEGLVIVDVDGTQATVSKDNVATVGGIEILPIQTNYNYGGIKAQRSAVLIIGEDIFQDIKTSDTFEDDWKWDIDSLNEKKAAELSVWKVSGPYIGVKNNPSWKSLDSEECISIPNDYPTICISSLEDYFSEKELEQNEELLSTNTEEPTCKKDYQSCNDNSECCSQNCCEGVCLYSKTLCNKEEGSIGEEKVIKEPEVLEEKEEVTRASEEPTTQPKEKKGYVPFTKRIFEWILSWFK